MYALELAQRQTFSFPQWDEPTFTLDVRYRDGELFESDFDALAAVDHFLAYFGVVMKSLLQPTSTGGSSVEEISPEKVGAAAAHLALSSDWQIFHERRLFWEHGCTTVSEDGSKFDSSASELVAAFRVSLSRLRSFRSARLCDPLNDELVSEGTTALPREGFRSQRELVSAYLTSLQFYSRDLKEQVHGASLAEWIRAYTILQELAEKTVLSRKEIKEPEEMLLRGTPLDFANRLVDQGGLSLKTAQSIVAHLTLGKTSKDLLDAPFVPMGSELYLLPAVAMFIEPAFSLESLLKSIRRKENHELNFIGPGLEAIIKKDLTDAKIVARKVKHSDFDCDLAFVLDSVLFLCECKGKFIASDFKSYTELENYLMHDAVKQHTRTCDYFEKNLQHVRRHLSLPHTWQPREIRRLIITSAKLGRALTKNEITIVDENTFHAYFAREPLKIRDLNGRVLQMIPDVRLIGELNVLDFLDFISAPRSIRLHEGYLATRDTQLSSVNSPLLFRDVECYGEM